MSQHDTAANAIGLDLVFEETKCMRVFLDMEAFLFGLENDTPDFVLAFNEITVSHVFATISLFLC